MDGESPLLKDGALSLQTSLSHRELPHKTPPFTKRKFLLLLFSGGGLVGKFWVWTGGANSLHGAASHLFCEWGAFRGYTLHECQDSACQRPFGVRRNAAGGISALAYGITPNRISLTKRARSRTLQKISTSQITKNFPQEHPHQAKRNKSLPCISGCSWGKFGEDEGGLEGEGTPSERGSLLPPRSFSPPSVIKLVRTDAEFEDAVATDPVGG